MNENEKLDTEREQETGQITYANEVIATIVSVATTEVSGISGISGSGAISGILGKGKAPRGVKVELSGDSVKVDISVTVDYGMPIQKVGRNAQENVRKSIESMTGLRVERVDLHVVGVSFEKENQELQEGQNFARSIEEQEQAAELPAQEDEAAEVPEDEAADAPEDEDATPAVVEFTQEEESAGEAEDEYAPEDGEEQPEA